MVSALFSPITLRGLTLDNRIMVSPMCQYSSVDGNATDWHIMHLGQFAVSGAGIVMIEGAHVEPVGRITHGCLGLYSDENERTLGRVVDFCRQHGRAKIGIQISHSGRKGSTKLPWEGRGEPLSKAEGAWQTVSCSGVPYGDNWPKPQALDRDGLQHIIGVHVDSTVRSARIGIDLLELHIAHGYLLHEFVSPLTNFRTDEYGGSLENRLRFPLEVFAAVREAWPQDRPLGVRVSVTDWVEGGWTPEETEVLAKELRRAGCDYITASSGGLSSKQKVKIGEGYQVGFAKRLRDAAGMPTVAVGMIYDPHHAERIITEGSADVIALARAMLFDPHWPWFAASVLGGKVHYPPQYIRGYRSRWLQDMRAGRTPAVGQE